MNTSPDKKTRDRLLALGWRKGYDLQPVLYKPGWYLYCHETDTYEHNPAASSPLFTDEQAEVWLLERPDTGEP